MTVLLGSSKPGDAYVDSLSAEEMRAYHNGVLEDFDDAKLTPGVYTFGTFGGDVTIVLTGSTDVFIIHLGGNLILVADTEVTLTNGALAKNIFWQVAGNVMVKQSAHLKGILLVKTDVLFQTGSSLEGRVLAQRACNLQEVTITQPQ
jgi:hypothetical protein